MKIALIAFTFIFLNGCASNIPMTASVNDFVMMGVKTNSSETIKYSFKSSITDGEIDTINEEGVVSSENPAFIHSESRVLSKMLSEYMRSKFTNLPQSSGEVLVDIFLNKFTISQYSTDSSGYQVMVALAGGEINKILEAKVSGSVRVVINGESHEKRIISSSESNYVSGIGTGTSTSNVYKGRNSIQHIHAQNINKANNKFLMQINSYLESLNL